MARSPRCPSPLSSVGAGLRNLPYQRRGRRPTLHPILGRQHRCWDGSHVPERSPRSSLCLPESTKPACRRTGQLLQSPSGYQQGVHRRSRPPRDDAPDAGQTSRGIGDLASGWEASHARGRVSLAVRSRHRFRDWLTTTGRPKRFASWARNGRTVTYMTFEPSNDIYVLTLKEDDAPAVRHDLCPRLTEPNCRRRSRRMGTGSRTASCPTLRRAEPTSISRAFQRGQSACRFRTTAAGRRFGATSRMSSSSPCHREYAERRHHAGRTSAGRDARTLFTTGDLGSFSVAPDGSRFLAIKQPKIQPPRNIVIVQHWLDELRRILPVKKAG